jgi:uncharacterized membrane protein
MTRLESWLTDATRGLSKDSAAQVRTEIGEHYESSLRHDVTPDEADRIAVAALGDAKAANRQYRKVLLTSREAAMLRQSNREARAICSGGLLKGLMIALSVAFLCGGVAFFLAGAIFVARTLLLGWVLVGLMAFAPFLPVYTPTRGRAFRVVKWVFLLLTLWLALKLTPLFFACLWPLAWVEWTRASIRRKLPVAEWPRQLYL